MIVNDTETIFVTVSWLMIPLGLSNVVHLFLINCLNFAGNTNRADFGLISSSNKKNRASL